MKRMTIGKKISLACMALVALTIFLGMLATMSINRITAEVRSIVEGPLPGIYSLGLIEGNAKEQKVAMLEHLLAETPEQKVQAESTIADLDSKFQTEMKRYEKTITTAKGREQYDRLGPLQDSSKRTWAAIAPLSRAGKTKEAMAIWDGEAAGILRQRAALFNDTLEYRRDRGDDEGKSAIETGESARLWAMVNLLAAVIAGGLLAFFIVRGTNKVLKQAVTELSEGAEQVSSASGQVSGSSQSLAQGASEQAASLEETSSSSEQMASMTRKNAENSQQAAVFMTNMSQRVADANRTLADMMTSMQEIGASSGKISKIIKVIDEIAFQTNILALNAAVEAARAGEAGMGFAVVAEEVRSLAQRSAQAARDTASLIEDSILKSAEGSRKLGEVAGSIQAITEDAGKVKTLVDEVEASSKEQAQGIEQISKAIAQMDTVTQRTAANAEESASASEELNAQSQALMAVVEQLEGMVGAGSTRSVIHKASATRRSAAAKPVRTARHMVSTTTASRPVATAGAATKNAAEFPLDEGEFKEF